MVEFALALPLLLIVLTAILQFGLMFNKYITITDAVRAGARSLSLGRGLSDPCPLAYTQTVNSAAGSGLTAGQVIASFPSSSDSCSNAATAWSQGDQATVTATYPYTFSVFGMPLFSLQLGSSASDGIE